MTAAQLLMVWEHGYSRPPWQRALVLLSAADPGRSFEEIAAWPVGFRDRMIARLRAAQFGPVVKSLATCPVAECRGTAEFEVPLAACFDLENSWPPVGATAIREGTELWLRPPSTSDLAILAGVPAPRRLATLMSRCLGLAVEPGSAELPELPAAEVDELQQQLERIDPEAHVSLELACPDCGRSFSAVFDILAVYWAELNAWARRTMQDVHALASRYGWSEREILSLSSWRRTVYLGLVGAL